MQQKNRETSATSRLAVGIVLLCSWPVFAQINIEAYRDYFLVGQYGEVCTMCEMVVTRLAAAVSFFILFNLAIGGYYDASLLPFFILNLVFLWWPSGLWLGFDRWLARRYPTVRWFR